MVQNTPAAKRNAIRETVLNRVRDAIDYLENPIILISSKEPSDLTTFVNIYFGEGKRERKPSGTEVKAELVIRVNSSASPDQVDLQLDVVASGIEATMADEPALNGLVWDSFQSGYAYVDSENGLYRSLELVYTIKYED